MYNHELEGLLCEKSTGTRVASSPPVQHVIGDRGEVKSVGILFHCLPLAEMTLGVKDLGIFVQRGIEVIVVTGELEGRSGRNSQAIFECPGRCWNSVDGSV